MQGYINQSCTPLREPPSIFNCPVGRFQQTAVSEGARLPDSVEGHCVGPLIFSGETFFSNPNI